MKSNAFTQLDFILIGLIVTLIVFGLIAVFSATNTASGEGSQYFYRQIVHALVGLTIMLIVALLPFHFLQQSSYFLYGLSIILLILVEFIGVTGFGAERWLAIGPFKLQPSEIAKLATVLTVASYISSPDVDINRIRHLTITLLFIFVPFILIARQPDLGTGLVFMALVIPLLFWAGLNWFTLFILVTPVFTMLLSFNFYAFLVWMIFITVFLILSQRAVILLTTIFILHISVGLITPMMWNQLRPYQQQRILTFVTPEADPKGSGYQIIQSKVAIGSGGFWGKGFLQGTQTQLRFLPAQHTDFIFSVIGEEWGFIGVFVVLIVFLILILYLLYLSSIMRSTFARMATLGVTTIVFFHIVINIGMTVGLAPVTGLPLPLISYGGSFLVVILLMMGFILNFSRNRYKV